VELNEDMGNLRKKNQTEILEIKSPFNEIKNTVKGHFWRLQQVEDRISGLKDKIEIKEKTEEHLVKQLQSCERNMQELSNSIKRPNLRIMGLVQAKGICSIFRLPFRYRKPPGHQTDLTKIESLCL
jgi:chromosome segregation ATPase